MPIVVGSMRKIDLKEVPRYSLGPLPSSLASYDGSLNKAKLMHFFGDICTVAKKCKTNHKYENKITNPKKQKQILNTTANLKTK